MTNLNDQIFGGKRNLPDHAREISLQSLSSSTSEAELETPYLLVWAFSFGLRVMSQSHADCKNCRLRYCTIKHPPFKRWSG